LRQGRFLFLPGTRRYPKDSKVNAVTLAISDNTPPLQEFVPTADVAAPDMAATGSEPVKIAFPEEIAPLVDRARDEVAAMQKAGNDELTHAMNFGDVLEQLRPLVPRGQWREFPLTQFGISRSKAHDCIKLAKSRPVIEGTMSSSAGRLSVREALKLLRKPRQPREKRQKPTASNPASLWAEWSANERRTCLEAQGFKSAWSEFYAVFNVELRKRENGLRASKQADGTHVVIGAKDAKRTPKKLKELN
jgi:hypothetical protein